MVLRAHEKMETASYLTVLCYRLPIIDELDLYRIWNDELDLWFRAELVLLCDVVPASLCPSMAARTTSRHQTVLG